MGRYGNIDYASWAKHGMVLGATLFFVGALGESLGPLLLGSLPEWVDALLLNFEISGVLVGLLAPLVFGIVMPLTE